jgi:CheY-like chemotaxis protein/nitrogen-specific signal transduction histidine kinase
MIVVESTQAPEEVVASLTRQVDDLRRQLAITERRMMEACRARSSFLANMSHELRTPLNAIIGYSELVLEELVDHELHDDVSRIHGAARHLLSVISDVLDLARIEAGRMGVHAESVDPVAVVRDVVQALGSLAASNGNRLVMRLDELPNVAIDGGKLRQIVHNLVHNACRFTHEGEIEVAVGQGRGRLLLTVRDQGIGMDPERLEHLFDAFTQGDGSTTRRYGGMGLGLALTRAFVDMLGGVITVESAVGQGSTFHIELPMEVAPRGLAKAATIVAESRGPDPRRAGDVVLVIDDDPSVRDVVRRTLEPLGFTVHDAATGEEGLELARQIKPRLITLDLLLPGVDGFQVLHELKNDPQLADTSVVLMSMVDERPRAVGLGATDYLVKPVDRGDLVDTVHRLLCPEAGTVLVAEDDPATRAMVRRTLEKEGWKVLAAEDGRRALEILETETIHAVLLDLMMPDVDGFAVAARMREDERWRDIPVVVLTAMDLTANDLSRLRGRVENVLLKGAFAQRDLLRQVREMVQPYARSAGR